MSKMSEGAERAVQSIQRISLPTTPMRELVDTLTDAQVVIRAYIMAEEAGTLGERYTPERAEFELRCVALSKAIDTVEAKAARTLGSTEAVDIVKQAEVFATFLRGGVEPTAKAA